MSKRHQSSRRKTYGRRQHEVRERTDRHQQQEGFDLELTDWGPSAPSDPFASVDGSASGAASAPGGGPPLSDSPYVEQATKPARIDEATHPQRMLGG